MTKEESTRSIVNSLGWLHIDDFKPNDGENVLTRADWSDSILTYHSTEDSMDTSQTFDGEGFYAFDDENFEEYRMPGVKLWLPLPERSDR